MFWSRKSSAPKRAPRGPFRPRLESLEERCVPNASPVFDGAGNLFHFVVDQTNSLIMYTPTGAATKLIDGTTTPVRNAHGFRDTNGGIGLVYVLNNGDCFFFDKSGTTKLATGNALDAGFAYAKDGSFRLDIIFANATTGSPPFGPDLTGNLVEFTKSGTATLATNARWVNAYEDLKGGTGIAFGLIQTTGNLQAFRSDSGGMVKLYDSPDGATQDLTDFCQTVNSAGFAVSTITLGRFAGTYSLEFAFNGINPLGSGADIKVGG